MPRPRRKTPDELMQEVFWTRRDICRFFRKAPKTIDSFIYHPDPSKRLKGYMINDELMAENKRYKDFSNVSPMEKTNTLIIPDG
jgi:hypothetical protein